MRWLILFLAFSSSACAQEPAGQSAAQEKKMVVKEEDEANIRAICEAARSSPSLNLETVARASAYCLNFLERLRNAR